MKKSIKIIFIISVIIFTAFVWQTKSFAADAFEIDFQADNNTIQENQTEVNAYIILTTYNPTDKDEPDFIPTLGYEAVLEYEKDVFESVTIQSLNDWNDAEYYENTGKVLATTKKAKENTKIAKITLKLKNNVNVEKTTIKLKNMIVSDGKSSISVSPYIDFTFKKVSDENNTPSTTEPTDEEQKDNIPNVPSNDKQEEQTTIEEQIKVDVVKDRTTAENAIPQTGEGNVTLVLILGIIAISIIFFIRYKYINRKIKGL